MKKQKSVKVAIAKNIGQIMNSYKRLRKGKIGNSKPKTPGQADKQAVAIAFKSQGKYKAKK